MARFGKRPRRIGEVLRAKVAQAAAHRLPVAIASSSVGAACPAVANAHATLARSCALNSRRPRRTACVAIASSSTGAAWPAVANAHEAVMESSCGLKSRRPPRTASVAIASSSNGAARPALANAHATLARSCGLKSRRPPRTASLAIASKSVGAARSALAKAHAVLASSCGLKSRRSPRTAAVAIARRAAPAQRGRRCGKRPRHVGEVLRVELAQPRHRLRGDRVEQHRRSVAGRRKRPRRVCQGQSCPTRHSPPPPPPAANSAPASLSNLTSLHLATPGHARYSTEPLRCTSQPARPCAAAAAALPPHLLFVPLPGSVCPASPACSTHRFAAYVYVIQARAVGRARERLSSFELVQGRGPHSARVDPCTVHTEV